MRDSAIEILHRARHVVVIDFPDRDVPEALARAGFTVTTYGGPAPEDVHRLEISDGQVIGRSAPRPDTADLVYAFRPADARDEVVAEAGRLGASVVWWQSGVGVDGSRDPRGCAPTADSATWRHEVEAAGLVFVDDAYIGDAARGS